MEYKTVPITLVTTVSESSWISFHEKLIHLGYQDIDSLGCNDLLIRPSCQNRVFVFPVNREWEAGLPDDIRRILRKIHLRPVLGVLPTSSQHINSEALLYCNEFLYWPCHGEEVDLRIERLAQLLPAHCQMESESQLSEEFLGLNMVGSSPAFRNVLQQIKKIASCDAPVLIEGESGTGKELTARAVHYLSDRRDHPFIPVNCGAIPDSLLENELFGHQQGAFTDAKASQEGLVCQAHRGTLFLDEVETFSAKGQVVLLRFLQDYQYRSLGSNNQKQADVRIIAASNAKLEELVTMGTFRKDLFYRLNIMPINLPPLSQRGNDVVELAEYFLNKFRNQYNNLPDKKLDRDAVQQLLQYSWPGNVRELENLLYRGFLLAEGPYISLEIESSILQERRKRNIDRRQKRFLKKNMQDAKAEIIRDFEIEYLSTLLSRTKGNVTRAAEIAGKERRSLGKLIKKHGLGKNSSC